MTRPPIKKKRGRPKKVQETKKEIKAEDNPDLENHNLNDVVNESANLLREQDGAATPPKKRGRPPKESTSAKPAATQNPQQPTSLKPMLVPVVALPASLLSASTGYKGWEFSNEEKDMLATQADILAQTYVPETQSDPNAPLYFFLASYGFILMGKGIEYLKWRTIHKEKEAAKKAEAKKKGHENATTVKLHTNGQNSDLGA